MGVGLSLEHCGLNKESQGEESELQGHQRVLELDSLLAFVFPKEIMPAPPPVAWRFWIVVRRILPILLTSQWRYVQVAPHAAYRFISAAVDEVRAEDPIVLIAEEDVVPMP